MNLHRTFEHLVQGLLRKDLFTFGMRTGRELRGGWICAGDVVRFTGGFRWATEIECDDETEEGTHREGSTNMDLQDTVRDPICEEKVTKE